jgi:hypothetical protein
MSGLVNLFAISFSLLALIVALAALVIVLAMKLSTHKIEWKPLEMEPMKEEGPKEEEDDDILEKALKLQKKKKNEDPLDAIAETSNF